MKSRIKNKLFSRTINKMQVKNINNACDRMYSSLQMCIEISDINDKDDYEYLKYALENYKQVVDSIFTDIIKDKLDLIHEYENDTRTESTENNKRDDTTNKNKD